MELMGMEREMTGLYLSGHPMDDYRERAKTAGATAIGAILADFAAEDGPHRFRDGQNIKVAGIVNSHKTRTTKNNSLMAYAEIEDHSGSMELIIFQRGLDNGGNYLADNNAILASGRISVRDEKAPQVMVDSIRPLSDLDAAQPRTQQEAQTPQQSARKLFIRLRSDDAAAVRRTELLLEFFPGDDAAVLYYSDLKKQRTGRCMIHNALVKELSERLGAENVVVK
jgi:DNA polymerase-3 subunit alpha